MIEHIVLMRFRDDASPAAIDAAADALNALPAEIDAIDDLAFGPNISERSGGYTHALVSRFASPQALHTYIHHPAHVAVVDTHAKPILAGLLVADLER